MIRLVLFVSIALVAASAVIFWVGRRLPAAHVVARTMLLKAPRESVYALVADLPKAAGWRRDVESMEAFQSAAGETRYREKSRHGVLTYRLVSAEAPARVITEIADDDAPFGGRWIIEFAEQSAGTRVTVTERGIIYSAIFRLMARYVFGYHRTMETWLTDLALHFGETASIQKATPANS
jgi:uncharacterized protein YndB with AHSA1/START domain